MKRTSSNFLVRKLYRMEDNASKLESKSAHLDAEIRKREREIYDLRAKKVKVDRCAYKLWGFIYRLNDICGKHAKVAK